MHSPKSMYVRIKSENEGTIECSEDGLADPEAECAHIYLTPAVLDSKGFTVRKYCKITLIDRIVYGTVNLEAMQDLRAIHGLVNMLIDKISEEKFREVLSNMTVLSAACRIMLES